MTPEQENELVARWMNWRALRDGNGMTRWVPPNTPPTFNVMACEPIPPDYRADPALNRELEDRLCEQYGWHFSYDDKGKLWYAHRRREASPYTYASHAEAVFAAAVMQAQADKVAQEGK